MSREKGTFNFAANFELLKKGPLDAKMLVSEYADLTTGTTWQDNDSLIWLYDGAIVAVSNDPDSSKNGLYFLKDATNYNLTSSWEKLGAASGSTLNDVQNIGSGVGVFSGITGTTINLRSIIGSGNTDVSISGDSIIVNSVDSTALQDGVFRFDSNAQTFLPYTGITTVPSNIIYYTGTTCPCPTGNTRMALNARLTVTELRLSTGRTDVGSVSHEPGDLYWDDNDSTITLHQTDSVLQQIGQELFIRGKNNTAGTILNGTVVYVTGSDSGRATIEPARASETDVNIIPEVVGMVTEDIPAGDVGFVTTAGLVRDVNTSGFTEGDVVYLSPTNFGELTDVKPEFPDFAVEVGVVTVTGETDGVILVKIADVSNSSSNIRGVEIKNGGFTASTRSDVVFAVGSGTYYLPSNPIRGQQITFVDQDGDASSFIITINGNGNPINSKSDDSPPNYNAVINTDFGSMTLVYRGGTSPNYGWRIITNTP